MATVNPVPEGFAAPTPYLAVDGAAKAIDFYERVFGAKEISRHEMEGKIGHAELEIGGGHIMLADEYPELNFRSPAAYGGSAVLLHLYVEDVDAVADRAVASGATIVRAIENQFYGDRSGQFRDPFGHLWNVSTHVEDVTPEEIERRSKAYVEAKAAQA
jgi:PhnB protein